MRLFLPLHCPRPSALTVHIGRGIDHGGDCNSFGSASSHFPLGERQHILETIDVFWLLYIVGELRDRNEDIHASLGLRKTFDS